MNPDEYDIINSVKTYGICSPYNYHAFRGCIIILPVICSTCQRTIYPFLTSAVQCLRCYTTVHRGICMRNTKFYCNKVEVKRNVSVKYKENDKFIEINNNENDEEEEEDKQTDDQTDEKKKKKKTEDFSVLSDMSSNKGSDTVSINQIWGDETILEITSNTTSEIIDFALGINTVENDHTIVNISINEENITENLIENNGMNYISNNNNIYNIVEEEIFDSVIPIPQQNEAANLITNPMINPIVHPNIHSIPGSDDCIWRKTLHSIADAHQIITKNNIEHYSNEQYLLKSTVYDEQYFKKLNLFIQSILNDEMSFPGKVCDKLHHMFLDLKFECQENTLLHARECLNAVLASLFSILHNDLLSKNELITDEISNIVDRYVLELSHKAMYFKVFLAAQLISEEKDQQLLVITQQSALKSQEYKPYHQCQQHEQYQQYQQHEQNEENNTINTDSAPSPTSTSFTISPNTIPIINIITTPATTTTTTTTAPIVDNNSTSSGCIYSEVTIESLLYTAELISPIDKLNQLKKALQIISNASNTTSCDKNTTNDIRNNHVIGDSENLLNMNENNLNDNAKNNSDHNIENLDIYNNISVVIDSTMVDKNTVLINSTPTSTPTSTSSMERTNICGNVSAIDTDTLLELLSNILCFSQYKKNKGGYTMFWFAECLYIQSMMRKGDWEMRIENYSLVSIMQSLQSIIE